MWCACWTALVVVMASIVSMQKRIPFASALRSESINYYTLALAGLAVWFTSARLAATRWRWTLQALVQIVVGVVLISAWQSVYAAYLRMLIGPKPWDYVYHGTWMFQLANAVILYGAVLGVTLAIQASRRARDHERRQLGLALLARDAELRALNARLEPHFLLNTLNSVIALIDVSPLEARHMLERLADLLRAAFDEMQESDVALGREVELAEAYLGIERIRFADRLWIHVDVPESLRDVRVPPFLLQPLVENAIKHGIAPFSTPGEVRIRATRHGDRVRIEVADSGPGFDQCNSTRQGHGLALVEQRLRTFAPRGELHAARRAGGGFSVAITLPA
jgi:LytS/YehU family sensor histidine kinase